MDEKKHTPRALLVGTAAAIAVATLAVYWPALRYGFINYDDLDYLVQNSHVRAGLNWAGVRWAFTAFYALNWHPVTWISHMLDFQLFGSWIGGQHGTNLLLHVTNALLLYGLLWRLTGATWRSAAVAAFFALHPLQVESVAWISERKNVLNLTFGMLSLWAYARYATAAKFPASPPPQYRWRRWVWYALALLFLALGLMSKPMLVTLPCVMLLLDWWPLGRFLWRPPNPREKGSPPERLRWGRLLVEKLPFLLLSVLSCRVTVAAQSTGGAVLALDDLPLGARLGNVPVAYFRYICKALWPERLAAFYPHPGWWPGWVVAGAAAALLLATLALLPQARTRPALLVGWLWFLGTLVPVIGVVQVGWQSMADRYAYMPVIGLFVVLVWGAADLISAAARRAGDARATAWRRCLFLTTFAALAGCALVSSRQLRYWQDSEHLFRHALAVTGENAFAQAYLGNALVEKNKLDDGIAHLQRAAQLRKAWPEVHYSLAYAFGLKPNWTGAEAHYRQALQLRPNYPSALNNLAWLLATAPDPKLRNGLEAIRLAEQACQLTGFQNNLMIGTLAAAYAESDRFPDAIRTAQQASLLAAESGDAALAKVHLELQNIYRSGHPYHQPASGESTTK